MNISKNNQQKVKIGFDLINWSFKVSLTLKHKSGKSYWGGRLSTVDLLVLTSLNQLIFISKKLFSFITKQATLMRRSTALNLLPPQLVSIPCTNLKSFSFLLPFNCMLNLSVRLYLIGLYLPLDGITNPKYKLLCFLTTIFCQDRKALWFTIKQCVFRICIYYRGHHWKCIQIKITNFIILSETRHLYLVVFTNS